MKTNVWSSLAIFLLVFGTAACQVSPQSFQKIEFLFKEKCEKQGVPEVLQSLKDEQPELESCILYQINNTRFQKMVEEARKTGSQGKVLATYCKKWPDFYDCFKPIMLTVRPCMTEIEQKAYDKGLDVIEDMLEYVCFRDGERIEKFVAKGGVVCVREQITDIMKCISATVGERPEEFSVPAIPSFLITEDQCREFNKLQQCVTAELRQCPDTTPAKIVEDLAKIWGKKMECPIISSALSIQQNSILVILTLFLLVKLY